MSLEVNSIFDKIACPIFVAEPTKADDGKIADFTITFLNSKMEELVGETIKVGSKGSELVKLTSYEVPWQQMIVCSKNKIPYPYFSFYSLRTEKWFKIDLETCEDESFVVTLVDITSEKNYSSKLRASLTKDTFTGLSNRSAFQDELNEVIKNSRKNNTTAGVLILDIDNMKSINDSQGSTKGDSLILQVAEILKTFQRDFLKVFRYGDDEFLILISNGNSYDTIANYCDAIFERFLMESINISGGISVYPSDSEQKDELIRFADMALHYAKRNGRNNFTYFEPEMQRAFIQRLTLQSKMTDAIIESNFKQYYQPQFDINTGKLRGFEALIRWFDNELGEITPSVFIPLAEESSLIVPIGRWVLNTALSALKKWQDKYHFDGIMSVNVSPIQLMQDGFISELYSLIEKYQINPNLLEIEITEGVMINDIDSTVAKLNAIKDMGIRLSLDDFGTGYSSLSYLQALPLNTLKIDKSFINNLTDENGVQATITSSIISMVKEMGLETIAEGVEDPAQLALLSEFNCNVVQGFLRGKPMPFSSCDAFLAGDQKALTTL